MLKGQVAVRLKAFAATLVMLAALPVPADQWAPEIRFELEGADYVETVRWVSGLAYGLTGYSVKLEAEGMERVFCLPEGEVVDAQRVLAILNRRFGGQTVTPDQATGAVLQGLEAEYRCRGR